jgi:hypothetical protein
MMHPKTLVRSTLLVALLASAAGAQIYRHYTPGTTWSVTAIRMHAGMDAAYLQYLDTSLKRDHDALVKAGYMKSYKILRTMDDDQATWNLLILREYASLSAFEANEEKSDVLSRQFVGDDDAQMTSYVDRSKIRDVVWTRMAREFVLK